MTDAIAQWAGIAVLFGALIGAWVRINAQIAKLETKAMADKVTCDGAMALIRAEVVAVEQRAAVSIEGVVAQLRPQLTRIEERVDRLLERHG